MKAKKPQTLPKHKSGFDRFVSYDREKRAPLTQIEMLTYVKRGFVSVDPGARSGIAYFSAEPELQGMACVTHIDAVKQVQDFCGLLVCEMPRVYPLQAGKVDPNDLLQLAFKIGQLTQAARAWVLVEPRDWKRGASKEVTAQRAAAALAPRERARCANFVRDTAESYMHNGLDAMAIGLWILGRVDFGVASPLIFRDPVGA